MRESNKRPRRTPLTSEEVSHIIAHKRKKELVALRKLKKSGTFKILNVFIVCCMFTYLEVLFCYFGPCHYEQRTSERVVVHYGTGSRQGRLLITDMDIYSGTKMYTLIVGDHIDPPAQTSNFIIGRDFLLQKELKAVLDHPETAYRLFAASPVLFLCALVSFISFFGFIMNLNETVYGLRGLTTLNVLTLLAILCI